MANMVDIGSHTLWSCLDNSFLLKMAIDSEFRSRNGDIPLL